MNRELTLLGGIGLGAAVMYLLDPQQGRRRRSLARDQVSSLMHQAGHVVDPTARDLTNRTRGLVAEAAATLMGKEVPDEVLVPRVRSKLGRFVSHPRAIEVMAHQGHVMLRGPILAHELKDMLTAVSHIRGVKSINNQLDVHKEPGNVPGLQGGRPRPGQQFELMQDNWSPTARLLVGTAGSTLTLVGAKQRGVFGTLVGSLGVGMLARALTNLQLKRLLGVDAGHRAVDIQKDITVDAPLEEMYAFWANFENFPRFMSHVREVRNLENGRSHWVVDGPAGVPVSWNAVITKQIENDTLAWRSEPGSVVGNAGIIRFTPVDGRTRIHIKLSYNPPAGAIGHGVATFFGSDPKTAMDEDLVQFKTLIELGKTTADRGTVTREELEPAMDREQ